MVCVEVWSIMRYFITYQSITCQELMQLLLLSPSGKTLRHQSVIQLTNLKLLIVFCVLLFASKILNISTYTAITNLNFPPFHLPHMLQNVVSLVYLLPNKKKCTSTDLNYVRYSELHHGDILVLSSMYLDEEGNYIVAGCHQGYLLDKPNAHRLLELCHNAIPIFHMLQISHCP